MILNQITIPCHDYQASVSFYRTLGLVLVVDAPPRYARFETQGGEGATISLHLVSDSKRSDAIVYFDHPSAKALDEHVEFLIKKDISFIKRPTDEPWGWREARLFDPAENEICLMYAGRNRRFPPWRVDGPGG